MDYKKIYNSLIERAKDRIPDGYVERHHIVPRCMGGSDDKTNLVALYPEEHFLCHVLLVKMYPKNANLILAVGNMCRPIPSGRKKRKLYGWLRREFAKTQSKNQSGSNNSQYGMKWINNGESSRKIRSIDPLPEGWSYGAIFPSRRGVKAPRQRKPKCCVKCSSILTEQIKSKYCNECRPTNPNSKYDDRYIYGVMSSVGFDFKKTAELLGWKRWDGNNLNRMKRIMNSHN